MIFLRRPFICVILCACALEPLAVFAAKARSARPADPGPAYKGAITLDATTGNVLFEENADIVSPPASMTKLMTFLVIHDKLQGGALTLSTPVKISPEDSRIGGTQVYLDPKETFSVEELLYAMMIQSANDAAHALARTAAGSVPAFVELMNTRARELGMAHTTFRTPHGLPPANRRLTDGDLTTPRDFALLSLALLRNTDITKYTSVRSRKFGEGVRAPDKVIAMTNHHHLLTKVAGVDGLKTGFTNGAGFCLAATALRNNRRVIVIVMGSPESKIRDIKVAELLERGFAALPPGSPAFAQSATASSSPFSPAPLPAAEKAAPEASPEIKFALPPAKRK